MGVAKVSQTLSIPKHQSLSVCVPVLKVISAVEKKRVWFVRLSGSGDKATSSPFPVHSQILSNIWLFSHLFSDNRPICALFNQMLIFKIYFIHLCKITKYPTSSTESNHSIERVGTEAVPLNGPDEQTQAHSRPPKLYGVPKINKPEVPP